MDKSQINPPGFHNVQKFEVASWRDSEESPCTQVHVLFAVPDLSAVLIMRLKSREACNSLIAALIEHRDFVFDPASATKH